MPRHSTWPEERRAVDAALRSLFRALESRPVPELFRSVVEQLDAAAASPPELRGQA